MRSGTAYGGRKVWAVVGVLLFLICRGALALSDDFDGALSTAWDPPQVPFPGSSVSAPVADPAALDGAVVELIYPGRMPASYSGPEWATQLQTADARQYGVYEARLRPAAARAGEGVVSAFFTYFNDGLDHDGDGLVDNHEIDFELLAAEPAVVYLTVWTAYQADASGEAFRKLTRKINLRSGRMWQTPPGGEGTYDLAEIAPLGWRARRFSAPRAYRTYRFEWQTTEVIFSIDLEDGQGFRTLWDLTGAPNAVIPSLPAPCFFNLWHNAEHWNTGRVARPPRRAARFRVDRVSLP
jgi:hypothetical protein